MIDLVLNILIVQMQMIGNQMKINDVVDEIKLMMKYKKKETNYIFSKKMKDFSKLINKENINRLNCVILPMEAFLKAFKIR